MVRSFSRAFAVWIGVAVGLAWAVALGCASFASAPPGAADADDGDRASDAAAPFSCDRVDAAFCDDFETLPLGAKWGPDAQQSNDGALTLVDGSVGSPLYALRSTVPDLGPVADGRVGFAQLEHIQARDLSLPVVIVEADLRIDAIADPGAGTVYVLALFFAADRHLLLAVSNNGYAVVLPSGAAGSDAGPTGDLQNAFSMPPLHSWFHLRIEADLTAQLVSVYVDGALRVDKASGVFSSEPQYALLVGAVAAPASGPTDVTLDNVTISAR